MEKSDVTSMRKSKSHEGGIAELLNFKQKNKDMNEFIKVPMSEKLAYCFGDPALTLIYTITTTLLTYFYTNVVGISVGAVGMILLLSRVFDGFSDVLMGTIIDRTHSKYGKARIWILRLALPYATAAVLLFTMAAVWQHRQDYLCIFDIQSDEHRCIHGNQPAISFAGIADEP